MTKKKVMTIAGIIVAAAALTGVIVPGIIRANREEIVTEVQPVVRAQNPQVRTISVDSELIGTVEPDSIAYVTPLGAGEVTSIGIKTGDVVTAGQLLCVIDTKQVESAKISVETARVSYEDSKRDLDRNAVLHAAGDVSDAAYQTMVDNTELARLRYESAKVDYNIQLESSQVTAPISGRIESFNVRLHDMISPQTTICVISGDGGKAVTFYVPERIMTGLQVGDSIRVEKNGTDHSASISEVSTMIDENFGLFKVKASVPSGTALATGISVKLYVTSQKAENVLTVPINCIYYEGGVPCVYTYADGTLKKNEITVGLSDDQYAEVQAGIRDGDKVVTTWTKEMFEGSMVTLEGETTEENEKAEQTEVESSSSVQ
ncbi:efflux RND transporter periplasmic adaptor subunit [Lacrimispora sp.]|uniref:efflux RND transporter periplasmic adaptor subunit n=1 Tax=Lacrimispora sp. TaxID=2719234 RepID=UPI0028AB1E3D|nr:efflux RND transporter periplasmic adaptor subunit [Lacrimispora sp.]